MIVIQSDRSFFTATLAINHLDLRLRRGQRSEKGQMLRTGQALSKN